MTVHAAKGLEFPVVLLAIARSTDRSEPCVVDRVLGCLDLRLGDNENIFRKPSYDAAVEREARHADAESRGLFYVAYRVCATTSSCR